MPLSLTAPTVSAIAEKLYKYYKYYKYFNQVGARFDTGAPLLVFINQKKFFRPIRKKPISNKVVPMY